MNLVYLLLAFVINFDNSQCQNDVNQIIDTVINSNDIEHFLTHYARFNTDMSIRYRSFPMCNKNIIHMKDSKLQFESACVKNFYNKLLSDNENKSIYKNDMSQHKATIIIDSLKITGNNAIVKMRIPIEGVYGTFNLDKKKKWNIIKLDVFER